MKLLRTLRLDPSDTFIFPRAAAPGEWAISGAFVFANAELAALKGKELAAFRSGFLGIPSLGWSTLAKVVETEPADRLAAIDLAAKCLLERFGAPDFVTARNAAEEEIDFAASLCDHPTETLIAVRRHDEGGAIREAFRTLRRKTNRESWHAFSFETAVEDETAEPVDLASLARREQR
jgi:uncharacterized protein DUF6505